MSIAMALVDYIPVAMFLITSVILQRDLYNKMSKGAFAVFSTGTIMVFTAGLYKATWKLLYAANVCDFEKLNATFFPMQATGFLLAAVALVAMLTRKQKAEGETLMAAAPAVFSGTMIFVAMMCLGILGICTCLSVVAQKMKQGKRIVFFVLAFVGMMGMGYLASKDFADPAMNWMAEGVNVVGQGALMAGVLGLHKNGLAKFVLEK